MSQDIPSAFICPITLYMMNQPVSDPDGNTYERTAIEQWISQHGTSPITRNPMTLRDLRPNRALSELINKYKQDQLTPTNPANLSILTNPTLSPEPDLPIGLTFQVLFDTSPSMTSPCTNNASGTETLNYTKLDIAKHALKTLLHSLIETDKVNLLSLVEFNSRATSVFDFVKITPANLPMLLGKIDSLQTQGSTDIWDAFRVGIELIERNKITSNVKVLLLTDGETVNAESIITNIQTYLRIKPTIHLDISTFGFGNDINSKLLYDISKSKNGIFGFMPDGTMLGTVFVNSLSKLMSNDQVSLNADEETAIVDLSTLLDTFLRSAQTYHMSQSCADLDRFCEKNIKFKTNFIKSLLSDCMNSSNPSDGQIYKSMQPEYFNVWGKHYLYSVLSAYENKFCLNFKDKAVQFFKTINFNSYQDKINQIYIGLPPPQPSGLSSQSYRGRGGAAAAPVAPVSSQQFSQRFYNHSSGCFVQRSKILVPNPSDITERILMNVEDIQKDMYVCTHNGYAKVVCVVKIQFSGNVSTHLDGSQLTEYHPVFINNQWAFPSTHPEFSSTRITDTFVYDYILDSGHTVQFPNFYAATFNHGITGDVIGHSYFGTNRVENDLMKHPGWSNGLIELSSYNFMRGEDNLVCGIVFD